MPELPEVEGLCRALSEGGMGRERVVGRVIGAVEVPSHRVLRGVHKRTLSRALVGREVVAVERRGKYLRFRLDDGEELVLHLRMTGDLQTEGSSTHDRLRVRFTDGGALRFTDPRHFGGAWLSSAEPAPLEALGPEPFDETLTGAGLRARMGSSARSVKAALLDQRVLAGVGNIWADEALFSAKLHPATPTRALTTAEATRLLRALRRVLRGAIETILAEGIDWIYRGARDVEPPGRVHARAGEPCPRCATPLERTKVAGRGTDLCPACQPAPA